MRQRHIAKEPRICTYENYDKRPLKVNEVRVMEVGSGVTRFVVGDRVCGYGVVAEKQVVPT
ncbi:hypothetical protein [Paenibacillus agricola]|uniref:Alcohol dehydrogenase N-terminal domain-containing protein n=1 Tax=Paenibacillus agricola TaxID=2716264 RepID=A0ABX0J1U5_9BACL|nr:hypothetical protein [Paenibacillus agricola]NHN28857.1 hypothetical protein [Paenibacillus agricola]